MFIAGAYETASARLRQDPRLKEIIGQWGSDTPVELTYSTPAATDDWPYLYLEEPGIPVLYVLLAVLLLLLVLHLRGSASDRLAAMNPLEWSRNAWHFFFLGAAFMLLEVHLITKAAVVLGSTWVVNAVIISGVLSMILLANLIAALKPRLSLRPVWGLLFASIIGLYFFDLTSLASLPYSQKALSVGALTTLPILFAGIVFIRSFTIVDRKDRALGANLLGALVGGLLQSLSFVTGISALLLVVAAFYGLAWAVVGLSWAWASPQYAQYGGSRDSQPRESLNPEGVRS